MTPEFSRTVLAQWNRVFLVGFLLSLFGLPSTATPQTADPLTLVDCLRTDEIPSNAYPAYEKLRVLLRETGRDIPETVLTQLRLALDSPDRQLRQYALSLLLERDAKGNLDSALRSRLTTEFLLEALCEDAIPRNADGAKRLFREALEGTEPDKARANERIAALGRALKGDDFQQRQMATWLLFGRLRADKTDVSHWPHILWSNLIESARYDTAPGRALRARWTMLQMLRKDPQKLGEKLKSHLESLLQPGESRPKEDVTDTVLNHYRINRTRKRLVRELERALDKPDRRVRSFAALLLLQYYYTDKTPENKRHPDLYRRSVEALWQPNRDNFVRPGMQQILVTLRKDTPHARETLQRLLEAELDADQLRFRWYAAELLIKGTEQTTWKSAVYRNLLEALRHDDYRYNQRFAFQTLYSMSENRPVVRLRKALRGDDAQARFLAAVVLAHYEPNTVQREVSEELLIHWLDDRRGMNGVASYFTLLELGRENMLDILGRVETEDWQFCAFLQFAACHFDIDWSPSETVIAEWCKIADTPPEKWPYYVPKMAPEIALAALQISPVSAKYFESKPMPASLTERTRLSDNLKDAGDRMTWAGTWYWSWFLDPRVGRPRNTGVDLVYKYAGRALVWAKYAPWHNPTPPAQDPRIRYKQGTKSDD